MAELSIRNLDDQVKEKLRIRAIGHGRSMESEVRAILQGAVNDPRQSDGLLRAIPDRFSAVGGVELDLPARSTRPGAADLFA